MKEDVKSYAYQDAMCHKLICAGHADGDEWLVGVLEVLQDLAEKVGADHIAHFAEQEIWGITGDVEPTQQTC